MGNENKISEFHSLDDVTMETLMNQATEYLIEHARIPNSEAVWEGRIYQELILATAEEMWEDGFEVEEM